MDLTKLTTIVSLLIALSIASERLVEIIKGLVPFLDQEAKSPTGEGRRCSVLQLLAVASGIFTAWLASPIIPVEIIDAKEWSGILALGLLTSGGSGFWNSILGYITNIREIQKQEANKLKRENP